MLMRAHSAYHPGTTDLHRVWIEIGEVAVKGVPAAAVESTKQELYEMAIEAMRHEVEKWDELKSRMEHSTNGKHATNGKLDTNGHVCRRTYGSIAAAARLVCAVLGLVALL